MKLRGAANGVFDIYFFLVPQGQLPNDPAQFATSPFLAALAHIFASPREVCDNCGQQDAAGQLLTGTSPITPLLLDYLDRTDNHLDSLRPEHVEDFLVKYLRWRVVYVSDSSLASDIIDYMTDECYRAETGLKTQELFQILKSASAPRSIMMMAVSLMSSILRSWIGFLPTPALVPVHKSETLGCGALIKNYCWSMMWCFSFHN